MEAAEHEGCSKFPPVTTQKLCTFAQLSAFLQPLLFLDKPAAVFPAVDSISYPARRACL